MINCRDLTDIFEKNKVTKNKCYSGNFNAEKENCDCLYDLGKSNDKAIGGKDNTKTLYNDFSLLIHYTKNYVNTEIYANSVIDKLEELKNYKNDKYFINYIQVLNGPTDLGCDDRGIYERNIDFRIFYNIL